MIYKHYMNIMYTMQHDGYSVMQARTINKLFVIKCNNSVSLRKSCIFWNSRQTPKQKISSISFSLWCFPNSCLLAYLFFVNQCKLHRTDLFLPVLTMTSADGTEQFYPKPKAKILLDTALLIKYLALGWWHDCEEINAPDYINARYDQRLME